MRVKQAILLVAGLGTTVTYSAVCWTNGASLLLGRPLSNPFGLPPQNNCNIPLTPPPPPAQVCPPCPGPPAPVTSWSTSTTTTTQVSTTTETSISVSVVWSTTTDTSTTTETSTVTACTATTTSWGIDPAVAAAATARCLAANPAQNLPVFNAQGRPKCCLPISTTGANAQPTRIC